MAKELILDEEYFDDESASAASGTTELELDLTTFSGLVALEPGEYNAVIDKATYYPPKEGKPQGLLVINMHVVDDPDFAGAMITDWITMSKKAAEFRLPPYMKVVGVVAEKGARAVDLQLGSWGGTRLNVVMAFQTYKGVRSLRVRNVLPYRELS